MIKGLQNFQANFKTFEQKASETHYLLSFCCLSGLEQLK